MLGLLCGCSEDPSTAKGQLEFKIGNVAAESAPLKALPGDSDATISYGYFLMFSVETSSGEPVFDNKMVPLTVFGNSFLSPAIEMGVGDYMLTKLFVVDGTGAVLMAAPQAGSELAYLVSQPLPVWFNISEGSTSRISPEVLSTAGANASMFGYAEFDVTVIKPLPVYLAVCKRSVVADSSCAYTPAAVVVMGSDGWYYNFNLTAAVNKIVLRDNVSVYDFEVYVDGFDPIKKSFGIDELRASSETNPLVIDVDAQPLQKLVLQPSAADGIDATVIDLKPAVNFGNHPYFEASYQSEPILTVMRTTNSMIYFNGLGQLPKSAVIKKVTLTLWMVWDSTIVVPCVADIYYWPRGVLRQIVEPWDESAVTWNNKPQTIEANQVYVDIDPMMSTNMRTYDVTPLFVPVAEIAAPNYGMMLSVSFDKSFPASMQFASSDHAVAAMHPRLTVYYSLAN